MIRLLFVARAAPHKGLADLLKALLSLERADWTLTVVGMIADEDRAPLQAAINVVDERIAVVGPRPLQEVSRIMREHDALVIPSRYENFCNVALEGLACGLPVIGVALGGIRDLVREGWNGHLFAPRDVEAMAEALRSALCQPERLMAMRPNARQTATSYSWDSIADLTSDAFLGAIRARSRGNP